MVIFDKGNSSVLVTSPFILPVDVSFCNDVPINSFVEGKSVYFWLIGEDAHDALEQQMIITLRAPIINKCFSVNIRTILLKNLYKRLSNFTYCKTIFICITSSTLCQT